MLANDKEGVVTTMDLSVELQAGGLTAEHVDFVRNFKNLSSLRNIKIQRSTPLPLDKFNFTVMLYFNAYLQDIILNALALFMMLFITPLQVTDRLNYEGRGTVQFLDYLTYVPLFIEIHDNINDNPLDFSRNR